jgi:hypothetical protein
MHLRMVCLGKDVQERLSLKVRIGRDKLISFLAPTSEAPANPKDRAVTRAGLRARWTDILQLRVCNSLRISKA